MKTVSEEKTVYTVTQLNVFARKLLENISPQGLWVKGEMRRIKTHTSGHLYLTLADEKSSIDAVMWRSYRRSLAFEPEDGMDVEAFGKPTLYEKTGRYQFSIRKIIPVGEGARAIAFRQLKEKLSEEGLFDEVHKKPLPRYPLTIGVISSQTGAALRDIVHVLNRRAPYVDIVLYPATVQGDNAPSELIDALRKMNSFGLIDVIIIGRGGGSEEDLWCFNDETLAREIFASEIPVISAVGHEIDFSISDFVADKRAPTPSAAAEIAVSDISEIEFNLQQKLNRVSGFISNLHDNYYNRLESILSRPAWKEPLRLIYDEAQRVDEALVDIQNSVERIMERKKYKLDILSGKLPAYSIEKILAKGFALIRKKEIYIKSQSELSHEEIIDIIFHDGIKTAVINGNSEISTD